jgi:imidazole glycerol-phosphate synthase subunit HisH
MNIPRVTIIDYGMGNVRSVISAFKYLGAEVDIVSDPDIISNSNNLILPGVGSFRKGMESLKNSGINEAIIDAVTRKKSNILGICLGMQLMGSYGTENGNAAGLGLLSNSVERFTQEEVGDNKIPHVGFNSLYVTESKGLFKDLGSLPDFYFTHSYRMLVENLQGRYATCKYGIEFLVAYEIGNICGSQFHPEKSQVNGLLFLRNFLEKIKDHP